MSEGHLRLVSLSILGGPLDGRRHDPEEVVAEILIGSDPGCHLVVEHPGISPIHAKVWADLNESIVYDTSAPRGVYLNTERVTEKATVGMGDVIWLGPPQQEDSVCVQFHFEPWVEVLPAAPIDSYDTDDAVVIEGDAAAMQVAAPEDAVVAEPVPTAPLEDQGLVGPGPQSASEAGAQDDPFFVGDAPGGSSSPSAAPTTSEPRAASSAVPAADDWSFTEPVAEPEPAAAPAADEFFVAGEPDAAMPEPEPAFIEAAPELADATPELAAPEASAVPLFDLPPLEAPAPPPPSAPMPPPAAKPAPKAAPQSAMAPPLAPRERAAPLPAEPKPAPEPVQPAPVAAPKVSERAPATRPVEPAAAKPAATPRPQPARRPASTVPAKAAPARRPAAARPAARAASGGASWVRPVALGAAGALLLGAIGFGVSRLVGGSPRLDGVEPARVRVGQRATLSGSGFGSEAPAVTVIFGEKEARVVQASPQRLEVEVPDAGVAAGAEGRVAVVVRARGRTSGVVEVTVFQGPRLHGIAPGAAMPGEEVMLAGAGWGVGATVRFGSSPAQTLEVQATQIRAIVPPLPGGPGTEAPVVVSVGGVESNPAPFIIGHLPVVTALNPPSASPGEAVSVSGRGFDTIPLRNDVRIGGVPALVVASSSESLQLIVPRLGPGEAVRPVELRVPGSSNVGHATLQFTAPADPVGFRFVAEPFTPGPGRAHALLATGLGPAFVVASAGGRTAADRAALAAERLNAAAQPLRTTLGLTLEARGLESNPVIALAGSSEALLEVTEEDAAAYNEDWTGLRDRGGPVTRARLARWWEALGRDLVLMTIRGQAPQHAAAIAVEGRVLGQLFEIAQRGGAAGVPQRVVDEARPPMQEALRLLALRVPPSVVAATTPTTTALPAAAAAATAPALPPLQFDGTWGGSQVEQGQRQYLTVSVRGSGGNVSYEGGITFTVPMQSLEKQRRDQVRFSVQIRGGMRHYAGKWDGETLSGNVSTDAAGNNVVATFELRRR